SRRQISRAATRGGTRRRSAGLLPVDLDPALGVGADGLSLGLSRDAETLADRRPPDPERHAAAVARKLLQQPGAQPRPDRRRLWPPGRLPAPCPRRPQPVGTQPYGRYLPARRP